VIASETMRIGDWLASRVPSPPPSLAQMLSEIVGDETCDPAQLPDSLIAHAVKLLEMIGDDRDAAIHLLAADAMITYAMEAAADDCSKMSKTAESALSRISAVYE
jgi:hypothetical protein